MKNITLSAEEDLIRRARRKAADRRMSLNQAFREWLADFAGPSGRDADYEGLMARLDHVQPGRRFTRAERNAR